MYRAPVVGGAGGGEWGLCVYPASSWAGLCREAGLAGFSSRPSLSGLCPSTPAQGSVVLPSLLSLRPWLAWESVIFLPSVTKKEGNKNKNYSQFRYQSIFTSKQKKKDGL